ncbi:MAG: hypothetical protein V7704_15320 [Aurantimonas endophytica]|uniref:Uncharacterized protein n=1 Tax=Aurantimonas endophytica TaxID=1522175 RepID=A0A7W6HCQ4_9HYPH|nr:hypothetical protein [Aurantimonas endophytica]MBB4002815.1 hypothetical protein [Aurantimonas endophytica]MCO6403692.1 hypothetical protein [Aurantimonas endophytica]
MTRLSILLGGVALFALPVTVASADCREEIAQLQNSDVTASIGGAADSGPAEGTTTNFETGAGVDASGEVSKDGSTAPLQTDDTAATGTTAPTGGAGAASATGGATTPSTGTASATDSATTSPTGTSASAGASQQADAGQQSGEIAKDGQTMPMEDDASAETAMSSQDAQSQQAGAETAAAGQTGADTAAGGQAGTTGAAGTATAAAGSDNGFQDAIERAEAALAQGDEDACMTAVEEAKGLQTQAQ